MTKLSQLPVVSPLASDNVLGLRGTSDVLLNAAALAGLNNQLPVKNTPLASIASTYPASQYSGYFAYSSDQGLVASNGTTWYAVDPTINAVALGADPTGAADSTSAIQAGIATLTSLNGGTLYFPPGTYKISSQLTINNSNIILQGAGSGYTRPAAYTSTSAATIFSWAGAAAPTSAMIAIATIAGSSSSTFNIQGCGVIGIQLQCNSLAGYGLSIVSHCKGQFRDVYCVNPNAGAAFYLSTLLNTQAQTPDTQHNVFTQCMWRCLDSANAIKAHGFQLTNASPTGVNGNTSFNTFIECEGACNGLLSNTSGIGIKIDAGDNNSFINCICYRTSGTTTPSVQLNGYTSSSDGNVFYHFSDTTALNAINILGNATLGTGYNPTENCFIFADANNGVNYPTLDTGCRCYWVDTAGFQVQGLGAQLVLGGGATDRASVLAQWANLTTESVRLYNGSQNHARLTNGTQEWGVNIDGSGNLRFNRVAGSGQVSIGQQLITSQQVVITGAATAVTSGIGLSSTTETTVGATGSAAALPANPLGYLVAYLGSTKIAIPYYNG